MALGAHTQVFPSGFSAISFTIDKHVTDNTLWKANMTLLQRPLVKASLIPVVFKPV